MTTARNTKIAKSRLGEIRFPPRPPEPPCEVITYFLPKEEIIKKYGPPRGPLRKNGNSRLDIRSILTAMRTTGGPAEAAELLGIKQDTLNWYIKRYGIRPQYGIVYKEKEDCPEMLEESAAGTCLEAGNDDCYIARTGEDETRNKKKTRLEIAREKLSKGEYIRLWNQGVTDKEIMQQFNIPGDIFYKLKGEWGFIGLSRNDPKPAGLTIAQALKLQAEMQEDAKDIGLILDKAGELAINRRVVQMLTCQRDIYLQAINHISSIFETTVLPL